MGLFAFFDATTLTADVAFMCRQALRAPGVVVPGAKFRPCNTNDKSSLSKFDNNNNSFAWASFAETSSTG